MVASSIKNLTSAWEKCSKLITNHSAKVIKVNKKDSKQRSQLTFTCLAIEALEKGVKFVQR